MFCPQRRLGFPVFAALAVSIQVWAELERHSPQFGAYLDLGQAVRSSEQSEITDNQPLTRTGVYLTNSGTYNSRLEVILTIGGLFWYALPNRAATDTRILFGPGVGQAQGIYRFGRSENPVARLQFGLFPHKYNPNARNLGEYLFRSGTYPGYLWTGGWSYVNSASYLAQGIRFTHSAWNGLLTQDFTLYMERDFLPIHDLSPAFLVAVRPASFLELGAGILWAHGISLKPDSDLTPRTWRNAYDAEGIPLTSDETPENERGYYTFRGFKGMARASLDLGALLGLDEGAFGIYSEMALLGFKDYPYYYSKKTERMPVMAGIDIPTFGLLDALAFEIEYLKSPFENSISLAYDQRLPLPAGEEPRVGQWREDSLDVYEERCQRDPACNTQRAQFAQRYAAHTAQLEQEATNDDWKWSIYARRRLLEGLNITAQVASDHIRHLDIVFGRPSGAPATIRPSHWYYVIRLEFGL